MKQYYVYILARPDGTPFYVGKGSGRRVLDHEQEARRGCGCDKCAVIRAIVARGEKIQRSIVLTTSDEHEAFAHEHLLIEQYSNIGLTNRTMGTRRPPPEPLDAQPTGEVRVTYDPPSPMQARAWDEVWKRLLR